MNCLSIQLKQLMPAPVVLAFTPDPKIQFAIDALIASLESQGVEARAQENSVTDIDEATAANAQDMGLEGFILKKVGSDILVTACDAAGAMYGGLELAEQITLYGLDGVKETSQTPYMKRRGTKFNIPLDVRTPSYTDPCDSAQENIAQMWCFDFWQEYIDTLARYRYNYISLWSLHPFPSMIKLPDYPDVALNDVRQSTGQWNEMYSLRGIGFDSPEITDRTHVLLKITIDEKIAFWQKVMKYAKERNIDFHVITWNIFVYGTQGQYGITDHIDNPVTRDYFRKSVKQMFVTYPDLAGIGLTTGENMLQSTTSQKEEWAYDTYGRGVLDAAAEMPDRKITFIHRQHEAGAQEIADTFKALHDHENIEFIFSFKYAQAHVMSATQQPYHEKFLKDIGQMKTLWTLRNDDNYYFRWGAPEFVRDFLKNLPGDVTRGFHYGSDQWVWGREFTTRDANEPRQIEIVKHWYHWQMWGRLGYDPQMSNDRFVHILQNHFPQANAQKLFKAWQEASMVYPTTTGFHWGLLDFHWYIEACKGRPEHLQNTTGFHDVNHFINLRPHSKSGFQSITDYVSMLASGETTSALASPLDVAQKLHVHSDTAMELVSAMTASDDPELKATIDDILTMSLLGKYYAHKIAGSTHVALYRASQTLQQQDEAVAELTQALNYWEKYTHAAMLNYINPLWMNRVGHVDWVKLTDGVRQDIEIAKQSV